MGPNDIPPMVEQQAENQVMPDEQGGEQASAEEQAQYETGVRAALEMIYPGGAASGQVAPQIMKDLAGQFDPQAAALVEQAQPPLGQMKVDNVAMTAVMVTLGVRGATQGQIPGDIMTHVGKAIIEELVEVSEAAKLGEFSERDMDEIVYRAFDLYRLADPTIDQEALAQDFVGIAEADKAGNLDKVLPGAQEYAKKRQG